MSVLIEGLNKPTACTTCIFVVSDICPITKQICASDGVRPDCPIRQVWRKDNTITGQATTMENGHVVTRSFETFEVWNN